MRRAVACVVAAAAVLAACSDKRPELTLRRPPVSGVPSSTIALPSSSAAPTTSAPTTTVVGAPTPAVAWQACREGLECGTMKVLLDPADATKGTIDLYVERRKARQPGQRIGTLLVNPGGPGVAGTQLVEQASFYFSQALRDRFDIVSWDPRGTGRSIPLDCVDDLDPLLIGADPTPDSPEDQQQAAALATAFVTACQTRSGPLLPYVSTQAAAQDMDTLRQALGEPKVSYFGFSYGSELGATWATMFPSTVRAAVLDGAANPNVGWEAEKTEQAVGLERAFLTVMQPCAADPGCPFFNGGDPVSAYEALSASLDASPVAGDPRRPPANQSVLFYATLVALRDSTGWDDLYRALAAAQKGDVSGLFAMYDAYVRRAADGTFSNAVEAFVAIDCLDDPGPTDVAELAAIDARIRQAAPHMGIGLGSQLECAQWPVRQEPPLHLTAAGAGPIVVVGTTGDAITPIESSRGLADSLEQGVFLTVEGFRHTGYRLNRCSGEMVDRYLLDLTVPAAGTVCS